MKKKITKLIVALVIIVSVFITTYSLVEIIKLMDPDSVEYCIAAYENEPSNKNLIGLCNKLGIEKDKRLFEYLDDFINIENFNDEVNKAHNGNMSDADIDYYHDCMIILAFKCCAKNDDVDLLTETILEYYPQIRDKDKLFYLSLSNDGDAETTEFFKANADEIVDTLETLYVQEENPKLKLQYLMEIASYYSCNEVKNIEIYKEKHGDELAQLIEECDFDMENIAILSAYFESYWEHLLTGEYNDYWVSAYQEKQNKLDYMAAEDTTK